MSAQPVTCAKCRSPLGDLFNAAELRPCPGCAVPTLVEVFPALFRDRVVGAMAETILTVGDAGCFFHPQKKAVVPCEGCGRFLCALCDVELNSQHLCPSCLEIGRKQGRLKSLENHRDLHDRAALLLATLPLLLIWPSVVCSPLALFLVFRHWKEPGDYVRPGKSRFILAGILAGLQVIAWIGFFLYLAIR
ncbi:MAG: hypothetical protein HZA92_15915 [Verrucomicrobia bacterium]|nr:hypothetical protein [Verrucomicrobiota bacterium]